MSAHDTTESGHGVWQSAIDVFLASTRSVASLVGTAGAAGAKAVLPQGVSDQLVHMLTSLRTLVDEAPQITEELEILVAEVHAKRLSIQALQSELSTLDRQLAVLERSMAPVEAWSHQMDRARHALTNLALPG